MAQYAVKRKEKEMRKSEVSQKMQTNQFIDFGNFYKHICQQYICDGNRSAEKLLF